MARGRKGSVVLLLRFSRWSECRPSGTSEQGLLRERPSRTSEQGLVSLEGSHSLLSVSLLFGSGTEDMYFSFSSIKPSPPHSPSNYLKGRCLLQDKNSKPTPSWLAPPSQPRRHWGTWSAWCWRPQRSARSARAAAGAAAWGAGPRTCERPWRPCARRGRTRRRRHGAGGALTRGGNGCLRGSLFLGGRRRSGRGMVDIFGGTLGNSPWGFTRPLRSNRLHPMIHSL